MERPIRVTVTGAAGQIGYALLPRILHGDLFGARQPIHLRLLEIESSMKSLEGVVMELEDFASPLLSDVTWTSNPKQAFDGASWSILLGGKPRTGDMERKELLSDNALIYREQGRILNKYAAPNIRVLVVANPCNTNCLVARENARDIPPERWFAMTRLDENRAKALLADKAGVAVADVTNVAIWGNHSSTQYPDSSHARIRGRHCSEMANDAPWLQGEFISSVQNRGAEIIRMRGLSSAASAAQAIADTVRDLSTCNPNGDWHSVAVPSHGEYGFEPGLQVSYPVWSNGWDYGIVANLDHDDTALTRLRHTADELAQERSIVADMLK